MLTGDNSPDWVIATLIKVDSELDSELDRKFDSKLDSEVNRLIYLSAS